MLNACLILFVILFIILYLVKNKQNEVKESFIFGPGGLQALMARARAPPPCDNSKQGTYNSKVNSYNSMASQVSNLNNQKRNKENE